MPYKIVITDEYFKKVKRFIKKHPDILGRYIKIMEILEIDPYHPSLRLHKLQGKLQIYYSISINMQYRIVIDFVLDDDKIIPIDIGAHDEIY